MKRERRIQHEKWEREQAEKERRRQEWQKRKKAEERQLWALFTDTECWHKSQQIRAYVQEVKDTAEKTLGSIASGSSLGQWIAWALSPFSCCTQEDRYDDSTHGQSSPKPETGFDLSWKWLLARSE